MNLVGLGAGGATLSSGWLMHAAAQTVDKGVDLNGLAALMAASAGMVSAIGAIIIGLRSKNNGKTDLENELLKDLLREQLKKDDEESA